MKMRTKKLRYNFLDFAEEILKQRGAPMSAGALKECAIDTHPKWVKWIPFTATLTAWMKVDKRFVNNRGQWELIAS